MYQLRDYQQPEPIWDYFRARKQDNSTCNPLVVLPTGAGKSLVISALVKDMIERFGGRRVLILAHQKELLTQNFEKLKSTYPECDPGIYSASLGKKQTNNKVLFCGIQSVHNKAHKLGDFSLIIIDECHLIPKSGVGMYRGFINEMNRLCGKVPVIGLTATPYRLDSGYLHKGDGALFTGIAHEVSINDLLAQGYLSPLTTKKVSFIIDTSSVKKRGGEFIDSELMAVVDPLTESALLDALPKIGTRKTGLVFCITVEHANHVSAYLNELGISCAVISGQTKRAERDFLLDALKKGEIRCLANVNCLTTGVDVPNIDFLIMLRPTQSPGLYVQMGGRGMRLAESKFDCLVLDYAGNINRHGPIDAITVREKKTKGDDGEAPVKSCPECESIVHAARRECPDCGYEFPPPAFKVEKTASREAILTQDYEPEWRAISRVTYARNAGRDGKLDTMRVDYWDDEGLFPIRVASEFVCVFHPMGFPREMAIRWLKKRRIAGRYEENIFCNVPGLLGEIYEEEPLRTEIIESCRQYCTPSRLLLDTRGKFAKILDYDFRQLEEAA
jgi:DNA repair protein RadD